MRNGNFKKVMCEHVENKSLSDKQLESLLRLQEGSVENKLLLNKQFRWVAVAAVFFIAITSVFYFEMSDEFIQELALDQRIGSEVAKNHISLKPLEIETSNINTIRGFLSKLDFLPIESILLKGSTKSLIGGRYCSIQGVRAAQLRLKDRETDKIQSLYQTVYDPKVFSGLPELKEKQKPVTVYSKGLAVDIWVEKGLLFALTREMNK